MIKAVSTSNEQLREGFQNIRNPAFKNENKVEERDGQRPDYDDQLLQHETSVDYEEIKKYNEEWKKTDEKLGKSQPKSILEKLEKEANSKQGYVLCYKIIKMMLSFITGYVGLIRNFIVVRKIRTRGTRFSLLLYFTKFGSVTFISFSEFSCNFLQM